MTALVATQSEILVIEPASGAVRRGTGLDEHRPTCLAADPQLPGRAWCGTSRGGVFRSDDGGATWLPVGLGDRHLTAVAASAAEPDVVWAGTEPSEVWRSEDGGRSWARAGEPERLSSSSEWSFPPRPDTHHVRWIAVHPHRAGRIWVAIEAGALISTSDAGRSWRDRVAGGPWDTHELAVHPELPEMLRVAAGDGYFESADGGITWIRPRAGLEVGYLRSVAIDPARPGVVVVSAASGPRRAYVAGVSDGRLYRRVGEGEWRRVTQGWPDPPASIAPLLTPGRAAGELWAADERGLHRSEDGGASWAQVSAFPTTPNHLRGVAVIASGG